ncbi:MAG: hypothetical protein ACKPKO_37575 [Candidatus Fonsibacter sp.]
MKIMRSTEVLARLEMAPIWVEARMRRLHVLRQAAAMSEKQAPATIFGDLLGDTATMDPETVRCMEGGNP